MSTEDSKEKKNGIKSYGAKFDGFNTEVDTDNCWVKKKTGLSEVIMGMI